MRTAIAGAGPTGLYTAIALARRGHQVTIVDRDPGPAADGRWQRRGVMQFHHPHALRRQIIEALDAEMPEVRDGLTAAGAELSYLHIDPDEPEIVTGLQCCRPTFERVLRETAMAEPGVTFRTGHAEEVLTGRGRVTGLRVDGAELAAGLVLDASGRAGHIGTDRRAPAAGGDCGLTYVSREYALRPGAEPGPMNTPFGYFARLPGYMAGVFVQENRTFTAMVARLSTDRQLAGLRFAAAFDAGMQAVPGPADWTDPARSRPIADVLVGGNLRNSYRGQLDEAGRVPLPGLVHLGDAVCTTNPTAGRGITTSLMQARHLLELLDEGPDAHADPAALTAEFDRWCTAMIKPWFDDHVSADAAQVRQWSGADIDLSRPVTSGAILDAALHEPALMRVVGPYLAMDALPATLAEVEPQAREIYRSGWRPPVQPGPTRDDLAALVTGVLA